MEAIVEMSKANFLHKQAITSPILKIAIKTTLRNRVLNFFFLDESLVTYYTIIRCGHVVRDFES